MMSKRDNVISDLEDLKAHFTALSSAPVFFRCQHAPLIRVWPEWTIEPRRIEDYHLLFVCGGQGVYGIDEYEFELRRGLTLLVGGAATYRATQNHAHPPLIIPVRFNAFRRSDGEPVKTPAQPLYYAFYSRQPEILENLYLELSRLQQLADSPLKRESIDAQVRTIIFRSLFEAANLATEEISADDRVAKIRQWMQTHPLDRSELEDLASRSGLSAKHFRHMFKRAYGMTPKHYQVHLRMEQAAYMLQVQSGSVKEIAQHLGYPDQYIFSKQFKAFRGVSPRDVKAAAQES